MKWLIDKFGNGRPHTFGRKAMIPKGTMAKYVNERIPSPEHLVSIHEEFGVNLNWLFTGKGERLIGEDIEKTLKLHSDINSEIARMVELEKNAARYCKIREDDPDENRDELIKMRAGVIHVQFDRKNNGSKDR